MDQECCQAEVKDPGGMYTNEKKKNHSLLSQIVQQSRQKELGMKINSPVGPQSFDQSALHITYL